MVKPGPWMRSVKRSPPFPPVGQRPQFRGKSLRDTAPQSMRTNTYQGRGLFTGGISRLLDCDAERYTGQSGVVGFLLVHRITNGPPAPVACGSLRPNRPTTDGLGRRT